MEPELFKLVLVLGSQVIKHLHRCQIDFYCQIEIQLFPQSHCQLLELVEVSFSLEQVQLYAIALAFKRGFSSGNYSQHLFQS
jgi:hypothetical protein